jgi:hypothetical protein
MANPPTALTPDPKTVATAIQAPMGNGGNLHVSTRNDDGCPRLSVAINSINTTGLRQGISSKR